MNAMVRVEMNISFFGILMHPCGNILIRAVASSHVIYTPKINPF